MKLKCREPHQLLYSCKIGDASLVKNSTSERFGEVTYYLMINSINLDYVSHKKSVLDSIGVVTQPMRNTKSGFKKDSVIYCFGTRIHSDITTVGNMSVHEVLDKLNIEGLVYYFLDDGTFHQKKHFGHLYCNTFTDDEVDHLIKVMYKFFPQKLCSKRLDKKKDGRQYPYIYIPVVVMNEFKKHISKFLVDNEIYSLMYKVGGVEK